MRRPQNRARALGDDDALHQHVLQRRAVEVAPQAGGVPLAVERHHAALGRMGRIGDTKSS